MARRTHHLSSNLQVSVIVCVYVCVCVCVENDPSPSLQPIQGNALQFSPLALHSKNVFSLLASHSDNVNSQGAGTDAFAHNPLIFMKWPMTLFRR